jgi:hypothetical protein
VSYSCRITVEEENTPAIKAVYKFRGKALPPGYKVITDPRQHCSMVRDIVPEDFTISAIPQPPEYGQKNEMPNRSI